MTPAEQAAEDQLAEELSWAIAAIEANYDREGSGPGSRFEGQRLESVQVRWLLRRLRELGWAPGG